MPRVALTNEQVEAFRDRAVDAALRLFVEHGYGDVSLRALARELGVSAMTPYRYFENKEALFAEVRTEAVRRFADAQCKAAALSNDPAERLRHLGDAYLEFALAEPHAYRMIFELAQAPVGTYPELETEQSRAFSYIHDAVRDAIDARLLNGDSLDVAHRLWAQAHGLVSLHLAGKLIMGRTLKELTSNDALFPNI